MAQGAKDSHLKNPPDSDNYDMKVARIRMKGFHEDAKDGNELDAIAVYPVNPFGDPIINEMQVKTVPGGVPTWVRDATANDSDKTFTVPAGKVWADVSIVATLATTATVGNRTFQIVIASPLGHILTASGSALVAATQVGLLAMFPGVSYSAGANIRPESGLAPNISNLFTGIVTPLSAGSTIRIWDQAAIDAAADDLVVSLGYIEYDA